MLEEVPVNLASLGGGAAVELFQAELDAVLKNIADINTDPEAVRVITLTVRIKPNNERSMSNVFISAKSKVASGRGHETVMYVVKRAGQVGAVETNQQQTTLDNIKPMPLKGI